MPKTPEEALAEAMTARVSQTLGAQLMQIVQLQAQNEALSARVSALQAISDEHDKCADRLEAALRVAPMAEAETERAATLASAQQSLENMKAEGFL